MDFIFGKQDLRTLDRAQEMSFLLTNGLGGYVSVSGGFSVPRADQGLLIAAVKAPNERITLVHRLSETLTVGADTVYLSSQGFADGTGPEEGYKNLCQFGYDGTPRWVYQFRGVQVKRQCAMVFEENTSAVLYEVENRSNQPCTLQAAPFLQFCAKEAVLLEKKSFAYANGTVTDGTYTLYIRTDGTLAQTPARWQTLAYTEDAKDGRPPRGLTASCCAVTWTVQPGETKKLEIVFSTEAQAPSGWEILAAHRARLAELVDSAKFADPIARQLVLAADAFIARRDSTNGKTILAGYPLFSDWGRDTMIALPGCTLATGRFEDAKSILRTFLAYEMDGLVPNLFPEGGAEPRYNTVDAALLLIDAVWQYYTRTGDEDFVKEAYPVLERIIAGYKRGTHHSISMDTDGLIRAGGGLDQVTWMDVCVNGILPTPRHGKPVEINAYWYNALRIMEIFAAKQGLDGSAYAELAETVKKSFLEKFYIADKGYLRDVLSGTSADEQLRCNQIWAVSMPFTMLSDEQERSVVDNVYRYLWTPCGLRTLSPEDGEYHGFYGGDMVSRDMAYHQGTTWVFPMGAYYLAYLKTRGNTAEAAAYVREQLQAMLPMFREGSVGQLPEILNGDHPTDSKGCFAQAWSVGEILRAFEAIEGK